jgi:predicted RND superfamily exporter protein
VNSITDILKRLNKNMHADQADWYRLPQARDLSAQYLLLYEMSLPFGLDLNNQINVDKSSTRFVVTLEILSTNEMLALEQRAKNWLEKNTQHITSSIGSGPSIMFAHIGKRNIKSMLIGTTVALILISLVLILAFRSIKMGLISMIPNLIPAAMGFGLWGILVGEVGLALAVVTGMTLGIVVDDTVHLMSKYLRARREQNLDTFDSIRYAFKTVGRALIITSVVLVAGFLVLAFSSFKLNSGMGLLTAIIIALAIVADFFLLPPLLMKLEEKKNV